MRYGFGVDEDILVDLWHIARGIGDDAWADAILRELVRRAV